MKLRSEDEPEAAETGNSEEEDHVTLFGKSWRSKVKLHHSNMGGEFSRTSTEQLQTPPGGLPAGGGRLRDHFK